ETRADADPLFTRSQVAELVQRYLGKADPKDPLVSPSFGQHAGMPPVRIHVGDNEVLLDDSLRYAKHAVAAGIDARADVWMGMPHGFPANIEDSRRQRRRSMRSAAFLPRGCKCASA